MRAIALAAAASVALASSAAFAKTPREIPVAMPTGEVAKNCIPLRSIRESRVRSNNVIDFRATGTKWYRNTLPIDCPSLGFEQRFAYKTSLSQLCSTDIITVLYSGGPGLQRGASCGLGQFEPVTIERRPKR